MRAERRSSVSLTSVKVIWAILGSPTSRRRIMDNSCLMRSATRSALLKSIGQRPPVVTARQVGVIRDLLADVDDLGQVEIVDEIQDHFHLRVHETPVVSHDGKPDDALFPFFVPVDLGNRDIELVLRAPDQALHHAPLLLQGAALVDVHLDDPDSDYHDLSGPSGLSGPS